MPEEFNPGQSAVRETIKNCKESISGQRHIAGYHCGPTTPILFVTLGNTCKIESVNLIKETIELAWNNIQGNLVILEYPGTVDEAKLVSEIDSSIAKLKSAPDGIFKTYINTKIFLFVESDDGRFEEYISILNNNLGSKFEQVQLIVVALVNEKTTEKKKETREKLSKLSKLKVERKIQGLLVLSNLLYNGRILNGEGELDQYRIAANVAFLSNSYEIERGLEYEISREISDTLMQDGQMCTTAYIRLSKPTAQIVQAVLKRMIETHEEYEESVLESQGFDDSSHGFRKRLSQKDSGIFGLEKLFREEIAKNLPRNVQIEDFPYFLEMDTIRKKGVSSMRELDGEMNGGTQGVWKLFVEYNYSNKVFRYLNENEQKVYDTALEYINKTFSYKELLAYMDNPITREDILKDLDNLDMGKMREPEEDINRTLGSLAMYKAKKAFDEKAGAICKKALLDAYKMSQEFMQVIGNTRDLIGIGYSSVDVVSKYYRGKVNDLFDYEKNRAVLNVPCSRVETYCSYLKSVFDRFVNENKKVFLTSFEDELSARIESSTAGTILNDLGWENKKLEDECRLQYGMIPEGHAYCIAFADADFMEDLEAQEKTMGKVFKTSRQESVERIMLCSFSCDQY